jgi:L-2-hydroxyglutarate oxidase LhgO
VAERYVVVGAGLIGLATARELSRRHPDASVTVVEKEPVVAAHQSSHNSGVVHAGLYYPAGSLKAKLCARGRSMLQRFCAERGIVYDECGKVVVATRDDELPALRQVEERAIANGVPGLRRIGREELAEIEPHAAGVAALHSPHTAIVDFAEVARALAEGLDVRLGFKVLWIGSAGSEVVLSGPNGSVTADRVVLCAGLHADRLAQVAGDREGPVIVPFRGEYWKLKPERAGLVKGLIYPVPDPRYPFLGVHFTRRVDGSVDVGPNAVLAFAREGYRWGDVDRRELRSPALRKMARQHWRAGAYELVGSVSKRVFARRAGALVPELTAGDLVRAGAGVRAQAVDDDGSLVDDFRISKVGADGRVLAVRNAPSPGATSCLSIAEHIVDALEAG